MAGKSLFRKENEHFVLAGLTVLIVGALLFLRLGGFGFWDPFEIGVADKATKLFERGGYLAVWKTEPPLTSWFIATGVALFGKTELGARLPLVVLGIVAALATYGLGARLRRPRAGLLAALVLGTSPLFVFQARQLTSDIGVVAAQAVAMFGLCGLAWPCAGVRRRALVTAADAACAVLGLVLGLLAGGLVLGVFVPLAAAALAAWVFSGKGITGGEGAPARTRIFTIVCGALAAVVLLWVVRIVFHVEPAQPGARALFGKMLVPSTSYVPLLGGTWRAGEAPVTSSFDWIVNQVAFGMFPWSAIAPIAVFRLAFVRARDRFHWAGLVALAWATLGYFISALWIRAIGDVRYASLPAIALAIGFFFDDVIAARLDGEPARAPAAVDGQPVAAVFVFLAAFILSLDLRNMAFDKAITVDTFASMPALAASATVRVPREIMWIVYSLLVFGLIWAVTAAVGLGVPGGTRPFLRLDRRKLIRGGLFGSFGVAIAFALFVGSVYTPKLAEHFSQRNVFEAYFEHRRGDEPLGVMGISGTGPEYYARGRLERLDSIPKLLEFLKEPQRVFAVVPSDRLCSVQQGNTQLQVKYHVVDNRNSRFYLFSNQLVGDEKDLSPLVTAFHREPPPKMDRIVEATFEDTVDLIGVDMPDKVHKGDTFKMTLWFKVKKRFNQSQQILVHFDAVGSPVRFQGDHNPKSCSTTFWQPGDIISDTFDVTAGELTHPRGNYTVYTGFFTGGGGIWKNMTVTAGTHLPDNRVSLGTIRVE